jgi:hypothetical protein
MCILAVMMKAATIMVFALVAVSSGLVWLGGANARAQTGNPHVSFHDYQTFDRDGEGARALRIPVYITLRSWENRAMGLRLRLAATAAATDIFDLLEQGPADVRVLSFVPGVEFVLPVGETHILRPFLDAGIGTDNATNDLVFLGAIGLRTELIFPRGDYIFGLEPGLKLSMNSGGEIRDDAVVNPIVTLSARRVLEKRVAGRFPDIEVYFDGGYDFQTLELTSVTASSDEINLNLEAGVGFGFSRGRPLIFGLFAVPRLRVGYRFGDVEGFRIRLGGDWLKVLPERR